VKYSKNKIIVQFYDWFKNETNRNFRNRMINNDDSIYSSSDIKKRTKENI
jgi:hypothetical protein